MKRTTRMLAHGQGRLALHTLVDDGAPHLIVLHALALQAPETVPDSLMAWPGSVHALDFTGHGASTVPAAGGYTAEILMADADAALAELGPVTIVGYGLGGYVGLLLAGARPREVRGVVLCDGPGIAGGGPVPVSPYIVLAPPGHEGTPDPWALAELTRDVRPTDYATSFVRQATHLSGLETPVTVVAKARPEWLEAVCEEPGVATALEVAPALDAYATSPADVVKGR